MVRNSAIVYNNFNAHIHTHVQTPFQANRSAWRERHITNTQRISQEYDAKVSFPDVVRSFLETVFKLYFTVRHWLKCWAAPETQRNHTSIPPRPPLVRGGLAGRGFMHFSKTVRSLYTIFITCLHFSLPHLGSC